MRVALLAFLSVAGVVAAPPFYKSELIFPLEKIHNHSSSIVELPDGDLLVCWFHGSGERTADDVVIKAARFNKKSGETRRCRDTDHQPLRTRDKIELLLHLDDIGIAGRLVLKSVQFMNLKGSGPTFVDRKSQSRNRENDKNAKES